MRLKTLTRLVHCGKIREPGSYIEAGEVIGRLLEKSGRAVVISAEEGVELSGVGLPTLEEESARKRKR